MIEEIIYRDDVTVELVKASASDADVIWAARVSTAGEQSMEEIGEDPSRSAGLINYLARERHGSPFEHTSMTFLSPLQSLCSVSLCATASLHIMKKVVATAN